MNVDFATAVLLVGAVLLIAAGLSGLFRGTVLSISVLAVAGGIALSLTDVLTVTPGDETVLHVIELALLVTLFTDGLVAERELVRTHWAPPARALVLAMPLALVLLGLAAKLLFPDLSWAEAFLLGAVLAPTDPVVTSTVVSAERVPALIRHTLNLESGLNDGLALPIVLILIVFAGAESGDAGIEALELAGETVTGAAIGAGLAWLGGRALDHLPGEHLSPRYAGVYGFALALLSFGVADATYGNGLIAAFVAGMTFALTERELPEAFGEFNEGVTAVLTTITFVLFGALIVATGYDGGIWALVAFIAFALLVARPLAVFIAFLGSSLPRPQKLFVAWFGPKGVASMLFALFVLNSALPDRSLVFDAASFVILASIAAHGLTDTLGARWIERHLAGAQPDGEAGRTR